MAPLFDLWAHVGVQRIGEPTSQGSNRIRIELSPTQMRSLVKELNPEAIEALMLAIDEGFQPGQRVEIPMWSARWLQERGMSAHMSRKAAAELLRKGYVRTEKMPEGPLGAQLGIVVPTAFNMSVPDPVGDTTVGGRRRRETAVRSEDTNSGEAVDNLVRSEHANSANPVDNSVGAFSTNRVGEDATNSNHTSVFPQVSPVVSDPTNWFSTAPSRDREVEERESVLRGGVGAGPVPLTRRDLAAYLFADDMAGIIGSQWETVVARVAAGLVAERARCSVLLGWLGQPEVEHPDTHVAQLLVNVLTQPSHARNTMMWSLQDQFRNKRVHVVKLDREDFLSRFIVQTYMAATVDVKKFAGWYGKVFSTAQAEVVPTSALRTFLAALPVPSEVPLSLTEFLRLDAEVGPSSDGPSPVDDERYVSELRLAADGTNWGDDVSFQMLLRSPKRQAELLERWRRKNSGA